MFLGIFVALALRFDVSRAKESQYFKSAFLGYTVGLVLTIIVMNWFQAAQVGNPVFTLLYLWILCLKYIYISLKELQEYIDETDIS